MKGCTWWPKIFKKFVAFKWLLFGINRLKVCQKNIPHTTAHLHQNGLLTQGSLGPWIHHHLRKSIFIRPGYTFPVFSCSVLVKRCPMQPQRSVLSWQTWNLMWSTDIGSSTSFWCCAFWKAFLPTTIVHDSVQLFKLLQSFYPLETVWPFSMTSLRDCPSLDVFSLFPHS